MASILEIKLALDNCNTQVKALNAAYEGKSKGSIYRQKLNYWLDRITDLGNKLDKLGKTGSIIVVEGKRLQKFDEGMSMKKKFRVYYSDITREDAERLVKLQDNTCTEISSKSIPLGVFFSR